MAKNKGGRPKIKLTPKQIHQLEALTAFGYSQKQVCDYIDAKDRTFRDIKNRDSIVSAAYEMGRLKAQEQVVSRLWEHIKDEVNPAVSLNATKFCLESRFGWNIKQVVETKDITESNKLPQINIYVNEKPEHRRTD